MNDDYDVLHGFFFSSRYLTPDVMNRYGLHPSQYEPSDDERVSQLRHRLRQILHAEMHVTCREDLLQLLGPGFEWVRPKF